jgi:hypothetical protein
MPCADFLECFLYEQLEPFGDRRGDLLAGMICSTVANYLQGPKGKPRKPVDFMIDWDKMHGTAVPARQTPEQQLQIMRILQQTQNKLVARGG